jgi:hypothetical protein
LYRFARAFQVASVIKAKVPTVFILHQNQGINMLLLHELGSPSPSVLIFFHWKIRPSGFFHVFILSQNNLFSKSNHRGHTGKYCIKVKGSKPFSL